MQSTRHEDDVVSLVKVLSGNTSFTSTEERLIKDAAGIRERTAYRRSNYWLRFLVTGQARVATGNIIPFTQETLPTIDTFLRIYGEEPRLNNSVKEFNYSLTNEGAKIIGNSTSIGTFYVDYKQVLIHDYWFPNEFFEYVVHGAYADYLRYDGQNDKALAEDQVAEGLLVLELENAMLQRNANTVANRMRFHGTQQNRLTR